MQLHNTHTEMILFKKYHLPNCQRFLDDDINLYKVILAEPSIIEHQISPEGLF